MRFAFLVLPLTLLSCIQTHAHTDYRKYIPAPYRAYVGDDVVEDESGETFGPTHITKKRLKRLEVYGPTHLEHVTVLGDANIYGPLEGAHVNARSLIIHGPVNLFHLKARDVMIKGPAMLNHFTVSGKIKIYGPFEGGQGSCEGLHVLGNRVHLDQVKTKHVTISSKSIHAPKVTLTNTVITGDLVFQGTPGKVFLEKDARVAGKIKNGKVER